MLKHLDLQQQFLSLTFLVYPVPRMNNAMELLSSHTNEKIQ